MDWTEIRTLLPAARTPTSKRRQPSALMLAIMASCFSLSIACEGQQEPKNYWLGLMAGGTVSPKYLAGRQELIGGVVSDLTKHTGADLSAWTSVKEAESTCRAFAGSKFLIRYKRGAEKSLMVGFGAGPELDTAVHPFSWRTELSASRRLNKTIRLLTEYEFGAGTYIDHSARAIFLIHTAPHVSIVPFYEWHRSLRASDSRVWLALVYSRER